MTSTAELLTGWFLLTFAAAVTRIGPFLAG
jgi:hypothetical protein